MSCNGKPVILGICGSPHINGVTHGLLWSLLDQVVLEGAVSTTIGLKYFINSHGDGQLSGSLSGRLESALPALEEADAIVIATPIWYGFPSDLVVTFTAEMAKLEASANWMLDGKALAILAVGDTDGGAHVTGSLAAAYNGMGMIIPPYCLHYYNTSIGGQSEESWMTGVGLVASNLVKAAREGMGRDEYYWDYKTMAK